MARLGQILVIVGLISTIITFVGAFGLMFHGGYDALTKLLFMLVPVSFLILFTGVATVALYGERDSDRDNSFKL